MTTGERRLSSHWSGALTVATTPSTLQRGCICSCAATVAHTPERHITLTATLPTVPAVDACAESVAAVAPLRTGPLCGGGGARSRWLPVSRACSVFNRPRCAGYPTSLG